MMVFRGKYPRILDLIFNKKPTSAATISHVKPPLVWEEGRVLEQIFWKFTEAIFCTEKY